jgi:manganese transport protein
MDNIRQRMGFGVGGVALLASLAIQVLTVTAEVGGMALVLQIVFSGLPFRILAVISFAFIALSILLMPFGLIERVFGYGGLALLVYVFGAVKMGPDWGHAAAGFLPHWQTGQDTVIYWYFIVGVIAAALMPYEVTFYSSGAVEERWGPNDMSVNRGNAILGFGLGGLLSVALIVVSAEIFQPAQVRPDFLGTTALAAAGSAGRIGLLLAALGMFCAVGGAAIENAIGGAYNVCQYFGWQWGKAEGLRRAPTFNAAWIIMLLLAIAVVLGGANPTLVTEYAVIFGVVALPLTYLPVLLVAGDRKYMGAYVNGRLATALGWLYFAVIIVLALVAVPLLFASNHGSG